MSTDPKLTQVAPKAANPANVPEATAAKEPSARKRIPMSVPQRKLEVPKLPGFVLYWFRESNVPRALQAGYEFVDATELPVNQHNVATDKGISGNQDMGSRIRLVGGLTEQNDAIYAVLMKIKEEYWNEDHAEMARLNAQMLENIFGKEQILGSESLSQTDKEQRYVKTALFSRPARKAR